MFDTLAVIAYLLGNDSGHSARLQLQATFLEKEKPVCTQTVQSPQLRWKNVPLETTSLALIVKDKKEYYWVAYNLPVQINGLPFGSNTQIRAQDEGENSWGEKNYHTVCAANITHPVTIELYALDKNFNAPHAMTGTELEKKIKGHVLAKTIAHA
jgi:phosphatidylethanolamine-binding protein (PEBP) family uncharacterized protein